MSSQDPVLPDPPTASELASNLSAVVDVDEERAKEIVTALEGGGRDNVAGTDGFRRELVHRLKQARLRKAGDE